MRPDPNDDNLAIISDASARWRGSWTAIAFVLIACVGTGAAVFYAWHELTLSHYDARAHLVVARRITDSVTPGWRQIGGVWLPLPHLLNAAPAALDLNYRTGLSGVMLSIGIFAWGLTLAARYVHQRTASLAAALTAPALMLLNTNVLYLQSTPMTEPMFFGFSLVAVVTVDAFLRQPSSRCRRAAGLALAGLVLIRYEGWCVAAALIAVVTLVLRDRLSEAARLIAYPATAVVLFLLLSWGSTGQWLVVSGFFVPDNPVRHRPLEVLSSIVESVVELGGSRLAIAGAIGTLIVLWSARRDLARLAPLALVAAVALPAMAFYDGHPHRIRYMVSLVVAAGMLAAIAVGHLPHRVRAIVAVALVAAVLVERPLFDSTAPMVVEAQWEAPFRFGRESVTRELGRIHDGRPVLASMGSLAHYMQEASHHGFRLDTFLHEGNGDLWTEALESPRHSVAWILIEERAEGGDALAARARADASFLSGFARVTEGGGLALYRRVPE